MVYNSIPNLSVEAPAVMHVAGPTGCGKQTVLDLAKHELLSSGISVGQTRSATTRKLRNAESFDQYVFLRYDDGHDMGHEYAVQEFGQLLRAGEIIECASLEDGLREEWYGLMRAEPQPESRDITFIETSVSALKLLKYGGDIKFGDDDIRTAALPGLVSVYLLPPGGTIDEMLTVLAERMDRRGDAEEKIYGRLWSEHSRVAEEISAVLFGQHPVDYVIVNDDCNSAARSLVSVAMPHVATRSS